MLTTIHCYCGQRVVIPYLRLNRGEHNTITVSHPHAIQLIYHINTGQVRRNLASRHNPKVTTGNVERLDLTIARSLTRLRPLGLGNSHAYLTSKRPRTSRRDSVTSVEVLTTLASRVLSALSSGRIGRARARRRILLSFRYCWTST